MSDRFEVNRRVATSDFMLKNYTVSGGVVSGELVSNETEMPPGGPIDAFGQKLNIDLRRIIEAP